jgi:dTDP-4-dehydrorhamnose 3,5-epimerase
MKILEAKIPGVRIVEAERRSDARGWFSRVWCAGEFAQNRLTANLVQCSISGNRRRGTLRGMHFQASPHEEARLVRCTHGSIFDVALDLRQDSATYKQWVGVELTRENGRALYIPEGCAHGFQTLEADTEVLYLITAAYHAGSARGVKYDDPEFGIQWPLAPVAVSDQDQNWPLLRMTINP